MERILVVDDDRGMQDVLDIMLSRAGYKVATADDGAVALDIIGKKKFDLVITDLKMPRVDGIDLLKGIKETAPGTAVILLTAFASGETALAAMREGAYDYVEKNFNVEDLLAIVRDALEKREVAQKESPLPIEQGDDARYFGTMVGRSKEMQKVYALIRKVADTPANALILGESGTGKELVARAIHDNSARKGKPFVAINCGGIPENLLESELFGYMKGSFTGAFADHAGLFEVARGGTIFLDEIAELPVILQVKLLRVVQEKDDPPDWRLRGHQGRRPDRLGDEPVPPGEGEAGRIPRGPLLPSQRDPDPHPAAEKTQGGHPASGAVLHREIRKGIRQGGQEDLHVCPGAAHALPVSGKHPGAGKHHRAQRRPGELEHHLAREPDHCGRGQRRGRLERAPRGSSRRQGSISTGNWSASSGRSSARPSRRQKGPRRRQPRSSGSVSPASGTASRSSTWRTEKGRGKKSDEDQQEPMRFITFFRFSNG